MEVRKIFNTFIFDGVSSDHYNVIAVFFGKMPSDNYSAGMETELSTFSNKTNGTFDIIDQNYSKPMSFTLQIINKDFSNFTTLQEREIKKWLCKRGEYSWFCIDTKDYENIEWQVNISNPQLLYVNGVVGMEFECTLNAPFGYSPLIEKEFTITDENKSISILVETDEDDYVYPYMEITMNTYGDLEITNSTEIEHRDFCLNNVVTNEFIAIQNELPSISSSQNNHAIYSDFNKHWIRLMDGENILTFNLNCNVLMQYREIRKVGVFS